MPTADAPRDKRCFVISPIGEPGSPTRIRADQIFRHVLQPALLECGYSAVRADHIPKPGIITDHIVEHLVNDALVIADLSERNPNVFYELAVRHVLRKPVIHLIGIGEEIPFDVAPMNVIRINHQDLDSVDEAKRLICNQITAIESEPTELRSPLSASLHVEFRATSTGTADARPYQLHHVSLPVRDVERSRHFYRDILGLQEVERPPFFEFGGAWFELPSGQQLHLLHNPEGTFRDEARGVDARDCHFALRVNDFRKTRQELASRGCVLESILELAVVRYMGGYVVDPDGHVIEINTGNHSEVHPQKIGGAPT